MQGSSGSPRTPAEHGRSLNMNSPLNISDSGLGQSFFPQDFNADAFVSTPVASEPPLEPEWTHRTRTERTKRWVKFIFIWILVALAILAANYGIEQFRKFKAILCDRISELDQVSWFYITLGCVFLISVFVNMFCVDRKTCKPSNSVLSPIPQSGGLSKCNDPGKSVNSHLESVSSPTRDFPCRRTFSGQGTDVWHDFRRYFDNISQLNNWSCEYSRRTLLCCLRGQAEAYVYGLPTNEQNDLTSLLARLEERFGPANMKDSFIADAKLRRKREDESYREFGQVIEDLYRKAYPNNLDIVKEQSLQTFLDNCHESKDFRITVKRTDPKTIQDAITSAMKEECLRMTENANEKPQRKFNQIHTVRGRSNGRYYRGGRRNRWHNRGQNRAEQTDDHSGAHNEGQQSDSKELN
ncbi:MAG: hypothetical protein AB2693_25525 [Candidatus Thiodiazotropha sp.]